MLDDASPAHLVRPLLRVRQTRDFTGEPVEEPALDAIADAGRWSGSSQNRQPWRFVVIRDRQLLRRLAEMSPPSTRPLGTAGGAMAIAMPQTDGTPISKAYDEGRAAERILVAASLLGLSAGIAWCRSDARAQVGELLGVPDDRFVRTIVAIGHPTPAGRKPKSPRGKARLPRSETVFYDRYGVLKRSG